MRLLGNLFQILSLQHFHEIHYDDMSMWTEKKSNTLGVSKSCLHSILVALLFFSVYAECPGPNIDILNFLLGLKTVCTPVSSFIVFFCMRGRWKTRGRGTGSRGVENTGPQ